MAEQRSSEWIDRSPCEIHHAYRVDFSGFESAEAGSCRLRTLRVCCRQLKHSSTFLRKPSSKLVVTQGFVFSHQPQEADSVHSVSVTFIRIDLSFGAMAKREAQCVLAVTHRKMSLPACGKGPSGREKAIPFSRCYEVRESVAAASLLPASCGRCSMEPVRGRLHR